MLRFRITTERFDDITIKARMPFLRRLRREAGQMPCSAD